MVRGVLLDIDGVLTVSWRPLPGAVETLAWLRDHGLPYRLVTNTSSRSRRQIVAALGRAGMAVADDEVRTVVDTAARALAVERTDAGCYVVNEGPLDEELASSGVRIVGPEDAGIVLLGGAGPSTGYRELDAVYRLALAGAPVLALHRNTHFETSEGPALDMGAFIPGLEAAMGHPVTVLGKPAAAFFAQAVDDLGVAPDEAVMVGDDIVSDVLGAQALGITGVLVRTGKFRPEDLERAPTAPDHVIDGVGALPSLLERIRGNGPPS